jgi:predicted PurR-regulated permease PerM
MDKKIYLSVMAAFATTSAICLLAMLAAPIAKPVAWALIIGISTLPYYERLAGKFPGHPDRSAGLMVLAITVCFILPLAAVIATVAENAAEWYTEGERLVQAFTTTGTDALGHFPLVRKVITLGDRYNIDLAGVGAKIADGASKYLLEVTTSTARNFGEFLFTLAVALFTLFFIYRDGKRIVSVTIARFSTNQVKVRRYCSELRVTTAAVTVGTILTCLAQGITAGIGYAVAGVPAPVLCAALTALVALVPVVGTAIVWVPLVLLVAVNGAYLKAGLLTIWCVIFVGLADNAIRPLAIGAKSNIPVSAVVLGAISGVYTLGILGLILGPVIFAFLMTVWREETSTAAATVPDEI